MCQLFNIFSSFFLSWPSLTNIEQRAVDFLNSFYKEAYNTRKIVIESRLNIPSEPTLSASSEAEADATSNYKRAEVTAEDMKGELCSFDLFVFINC